MNKNLKRQKTIIVLFSMLIIGFLNIVVASPNSYALDRSEIAKKWTFVIWRQCVAGGEIYQTRVPDGLPGAVVDGIMNNNGLSVSLPTYQFLGGSDSINCVNNFKGTKTATGVVKYANINQSTQWNDPSGTKEILAEKLKYKFEKEDDGEDYFTIIAKESTHEEGKILGHVIPFWDTKPTESDSSSIKVVADGGGKYHLSGKLGENFFADIKLSIKDGSALVVKFGSGAGCKLEKTGQTEIVIPFKNNIDDFMKSVNDTLSTISWTEVCPNLASFVGVGTGVTSDTIHSYSFGESSVHYGKEGKYEWVGKTDEAIKAMIGVGLNDLNLNNNERYVLYKYYLEKAASNVGGQIDCNEEKTTDGWMPVRLKSGNEFKQCYVSFNSSNAENSAKQISVSDIVSGQSGAPEIGSIELATAITWLNTVDTSTLTDIDRLTDSSDFGDIEQNCRNSEGAEGFGWIVCNMLSFIGKATDDLYAETVAPNLQIEPALFQNNDNTKIAWESFRDIANVLFIILLLIVIFSQLTGVGIDNYGIKKILPKLIVAAILINLSYFICLLLVDVSNIVGNGFQAIFDALSGGLQPTIDLSADGGVLSKQFDVSGNMTFLTILTATTSMVGAIWLNPAVVLSLFVSAIGVGVGVLFLFALLAVRKAAIIMLIAISPLAVIAYTLPNTKKMYDRWWNIFKAMLLIYPIAGLMVGAGDYASKLLLTVSAGYFTALIAMMIGIAPVFFIPTYLKDSFSALGKIGGSIAGWGSKLSSGATGAIRNTEMFQHAQKTGAARRERLSTMRRAGGYVDKNGKFHEVGLRSRLARTGIGRALGVDVSMGRARDEYIKSQIARDDARANLDSNIADYQLQQAANTRTQNSAAASVGAMPLNPEIARLRARASRDAQELKAFQDQFAGYSQAQLQTEATNAKSWMGHANGSQRMSALLQAMEANGMEKDITSLLSKNDVSGMTGVMQTLSNSRNAVFSAYGKRGNDGTNTVSFDQFMTGDASNKQSMANYIREKGVSVVDKLDDKSINAIAYYQGEIDKVGGSTQIMTGEVMAEALSRKNSEDELVELRKMIVNNQTGGIRGDLCPAISGERAVDYDEKTLNQLWSYGFGRTAMSRAAEEIARNPQLRAKLTPNKKKILNDAYKAAHKGKSIF